MSGHVVTFDEVVKIRRTRVLELQPCPFCGGAAEFKQMQSWRPNSPVYVRCKACGAKTAARGASERGRLREAVGEEAQHVLDAYGQVGGCAKTRAAAVWNRRVAG